MSDVLEATTVPPDDPSLLPQRVYIRGRAYDAVAPRVPLPPLPGAAKIILNWVCGSNSLQAKNIMYGMVPVGSDPSNGATLLAIANGVEASIRSSNILNSIASTWALQNVTAKDVSGTSENFANSTHAADGGLATGGTLPPQSAVVLSWQIVASYRGGKPRTYLPGIPTTAQFNPGSSQLSPTYASALQGEATAFLNAVNAVSLTGGNLTLGTISYHSGHAVRPSPVWRPFVSARVHERLDSQRRRSGKESTFPSYP